LPVATYSPQTRQRLRHSIVVLTAAITVCFWIIHLKGGLDWLENRTSDWRVRASLKPATADRSIVVIDIDNPSFRELTDKLGRWPWTRKIWADLVHYLAPAHTKLILFDALFSGSEPAADQDFADTIREAGNVMLPFLFVSGKVDSEGKIITAPVSPVRLEGPARGPELSRVDWSINAPNPLLASAMAGSGSILWPPDSDGITRRLPLVIRYNGREWPTFWFSAASRMLGSGRTVRFEGGKFVSGSIQLPVDADGNYIVKWHGDRFQSYTQIPLWQMICSMYPDQCDASVKRHPISEFKDKIVFIGASAAGSYEVRPTAVSEFAPGVFILCTALDNLLHNDAIRQAPVWLTLFLIALMAAAPAWTVLTYRSVTVPLGISVGGFALYGGTAFLLYGKSFWLPMSAPTLAAAISFSGNTVLRYLLVDRELSRTRGTLERYVSPQLVRYVMDNLENFRFDGEKKKLTVFFSDVRSFTTLTEKSDPVRLLKQLNTYLEAMTDIIFQYDGIVDKFIGDGIMAHWGAFTPDRPNAALAARAALDMMAKLKELNQHWAEAGFPTLDIGIGLNTGEVIFGNVGTGKKLDFTAIGDGVNLAARLESANKEYKTHIIISDSTRLELGNAAQVRPLGSIVVKGKTVGVDIYELQALGDSHDQIRRGSAGIEVPANQG
jgi:adenylate cyclase